MSADRGFTTVTSSDPIQLTEEIGEWGFEFSQLKPGVFHAMGAVIDLNGVHVGQVTMDQPLLHQGGAPRNTVALLIPGKGSGPAFVYGQMLEPGQCVTLDAGASIEAVTQGSYVDVAFAMDVAACRAQLDALAGGDLGILPGATCAAPGVAWVEDMLGRIAWLCARVGEEPLCLSDPQRRDVLADHVLAAMARFDTAPADVDSTTTSARASRRGAVRIAREFIHSRLSEPLRLSDLCRHSQLKIRSLEYGFREATGLTPIAYIRSLRLNAARRLLSDDSTARHRSISEIAMDCGFWHLGQFAVDYRRFFGETPTQTRQRAGSRPRQFFDSATRGADIHFAGANRR